MNESAKAILGLVIIALGVAAGWGWLGPIPKEVRADPNFWWSLRTLPIAAALVLAWPLVRERLIRDEIPDLVSKIAGEHFNREGFAFLPVPIEREGLCHFLTFFQNGHANRCRARVLIRPQASFFTLHRDPALTITADIECGGGEFGVVDAPLLLPEQYQGKHVTLELTADVTYPDGRGKLLRRNRGERAGRLPSNLRGVAYRAFQIVAALTGRYVNFSAATLEVRLPDNLRSSARTAPEPRRIILWTPGQAVTGAGEATLRLLRGGTAPTHA